MKIDVKILAYKSPQRYAVRRAVIVAQEELCVQFPALQVDITEVKSRAEIEAYTPVVIYPGLVVNERLVCVGRFPRKGEIVGWLRQALE
ncbi:MAG: hypothetical protein HY781_05195 [Chloroflexi bacterium]|nr:hypothetical protein [Chloroflexota bacterium]